MRLVGIVVAVSMCLGATGCVVRAAPSRSLEALETWNMKHPQAARELCDWVAGHPAAASRLLAWEGQHPERAQEFVTWAVAHPARGIDGFVSEHPRWADFDFVTETHRPAANAFMDWARRHPRAAETLMEHPGGLRWAARNNGC